MKLKCHTAVVMNQTCERRTTVGKVYEVTENQETYVVIQNDDNREHRFGKDMIGEWFDIMEDGK